mgnify:CR=1 FL=1|tara:strand:- start:24 stop:296 length:273 start_codon:yes stop_codon:yes gene_type:complete
MNNALTDILWVAICTALVLLMQGGFLCLETGLTRNKNNINVALKNLVDLGVSIVVFWCVGFGQSPRGPRSVIPQGGEKEHKDSPTNGRGR